MEFNVQLVTEEIVTFIRNYYEKYHLKGAVIGISGGKDSAVVAALFAKALGPENVLGLWLPCNSKDTDLEDAKEVCKHFNIELREFNLTPFYNDFVNKIKEQEVTDESLVDANINIKPRLRTMTLYYYAAMLSKVKNGGYLVAGTSNRSENYVGYFTKGGDNISDISVLGNLFVDEVVAIGDYLGVPYHICHKVPDDGLSNQTDEEKLGFSYQDVKKCVLEEESGLVDSTLDRAVKEKIMHKHLVNQHKFNVPTYRR